MYYKDIPQEIRPYLQDLNESQFNALSSNVRLYIYEGAVREHRNVVNAMEGSLFLRSEGESSQLDYRNMFLTNYIQHISRSTMGIITHRYSSIISPSTNDFVHIIREAIRYNNITNITLCFIDQDDIYHYLSFSRNDLHHYTLEVLVDMLAHPVDRWFDDIFSGSDYNTEIMTMCRLNTNWFSVTISHVSGGYGKLLPNYYKTMGLENNDDDCLIRCFSIFTNNSYTRDDMLIEDGKIDVDTVITLEKRFNIHVDIYRDQRILDIDYKRIKGPNISMIDSFRAVIKRDDEVLIHGSGNSPYKILYKDGHYDIITEKYNAKDCHCPITGEFVGYGNKLSQRQITNKIKTLYLNDMENLSDISSADEEWFYFFDYETVFKPEDMILFPYCVSICKCDSKGIILNERFFEGDTCEKDFIEYLLNESNHVDGRKYLIGYNNSRFDNYLLLSSCMKYNMYIGYTRFTGNSILSMNCGNFIVRDLCRILNCSLEKACHDFKIDRKKQIDLIKHENYQFAYLDGTLRKFCEETMNELKTYSMYDVYSLSELFFKTRYAIEKLTDIDIVNHYTLAGLSFRSFINRCNYKHEMPILKRDYKPYDEFVRKAIIGGRTQMERSQASNIFSIDCASLYPYVMLNRSYPCGYPIHTHTYMEGKIGVYHVLIKSQEHLKQKIVPLREKNKPHNWYYKGDIDCVLCSVDIDCLRRHNVEVIIYYGIYWDKSINTLFDSYFKPLVEEKKIQDEWKESQDDRYNASIRNVSKLLMNALSGKLIERIHNVIRELCRNADDIDHFFSKTIKGSQKLVPFYNAYIGEGNIDGMVKTPSIIGVLIYAYAREHMYENVISKVERLYGSDTDSAFITQQDFERNIEQKIMGNDFGQFKIEEKDVDGIFIAPKCYILYRGDKIEKARFKGVRVNKDKIIDSSFIGKESIELYHEYYDEKLKAVSIDTFRQLLESDEIYILTNNVERRIIGKKHAIYLSNHVFIKKIVVREGNMDINVI